MAENILDNFSNDQIDSLREALLKHDKGQQLNEFDLSKPPVKPYKHQEFPKVVYLHKESKQSRIIEKEVDGKVTHIHVEPRIVSKVVRDEDELAGALKEGYSEHPPSQHGEPVRKAEKAAKGEK